MNVTQGFNKFFTQVGPDLSNNIPNSKKNISLIIKMKSAEKTLF